MKKITKLLVVAVIAMMTITTACSGAKDAALEKVVEQINEQIKDQKMPGIVEMKLTFDDAYVVYNYTVDRGSFRHGHHQRKVPTSRKRTSTIQLSASLPTRLSSI